MYPEWVRDEDEVLKEALHSLEFSPAGVRAMLRHVERFCQRHGGRKHYAELLDLVERCRALQEGPPR